MSRVLLTLLAAVALAAGGVTASGADFTATSASPGNTFAAAADFNTVVVTLADPGATLQGTVAPTATASSDQGIASVQLEAAPAGTTDWVSICTDTVTPYSCSWNSTSVGDGSYDLRATATDTAGYSRTALRTGRTIDNYALTVSLANPGADVSGTVALTATAANATGGLQALTIQHRAAGAASWTDLCTGTTSPQSCDLVTTSYADGDRELRAFVRDGAGHAAQTTAITVTIDNSPPTATPTIPPTATGTVTMTATADDSGSGIAYVAFEALYAGTWYEFCRDTSAPFTCSGDSAQVADGTYSIRVMVMNNAGVKTTGSPFPLVVDNTAPTGTDVQAGNGGATAGRLEAGDWVRLTWSELIAPASVLAGWSGSSQAVRVRITDAASNDQMDFYDAANTTRLNLVSTGADLELGGNFVTANAEFNATMVQSGSSITITLGSQISGTLATASAATMTWRPSASATDAVGNQGGTGLVTESGAADGDF